MQISVLLGTKRMSTGLVTVEIPQRRDELSSGSDMDTEQQLTVEQVQDEIGKINMYSISKKCLN